MKLNKWNLHKYNANYRKFSSVVNKPDGLSIPGLINKGTHTESAYGQVQKLKFNSDSKTTKEKRKELLKREITSNPEFLKAFPHFKDAIQMQYMEENNDDN